MKIVVIIKIIEIVNYKEIRIVLRERPLLEVPKDPFITSAGEKEVI